jgi:hypothetical protein
LAGRDQGEARDGDAGYVGANRRSSINSSKGQGRKGLASLQSRRPSMIARSACGFGASALALGEGIPKGADDGAEMP